MAWTHYDLLLCSETKVSGTSRSYCFLDLVACLAVPLQDDSGAWDGWICAIWILGHFANQNLSAAVEKCWYLGSVVPEDTCASLLFMGL